jgi:hypothetical protein
MLTLVVCALAHNSKALANDGADKMAALPNLPVFATAIPSDPFALHPVLNPPALTAPASALAAENFSPTEFRPRKRNQSASKTDYGIGDPMFRTTTVWQRLNEFRAQDKVRVLTLWEMGGSNVSLQAGRKGDPWLQWSSSWTNRSKVSRGLLDRLVAGSLANMINRGGNSAHYSPSNSPSISKPLIAAPIPAITIK